MARPPAPGDARRRPPIPLALECGSDGCFLIGGEATGPAGLQFERLRLEIPDLAFPFEFDGDPSRFRDRRCRLHEATVECPRTTLRRAADRAAGSSRAFSNVEIDLCGGTLQLGARWGGGTHPVSFTVRARPADSSSPHWQRFVLTDCRAFGAPDRPVRRLAAMLADTLLDELAPPPLGSRASLAARSGMVLALRLPALLFSSTFAARGWKLPDVSTTTTELAVSPGGIRWRAEPSGVRRPVEEPSLARRDHPIAEIDDLLADAEYDAAESRLRRQRENRQLDGDLLARLADLRLADPDERALEALDAAVEALPDGDTAPLAVDFRRRFARCRLDGGDRRHVLDAYCRRLEDAGLDRAAAHGRAAASEPPSPDEAGERPEVASGDLAEFRRAHRELLQGRSPEQSGGEQPLRDGTSPNDRGPPGEPSNDARDPDVWEDLRSTDADDDPQARADALERAVEARRTAPGPSPVSDREYEDLLAELAELTFVELDESARALPHLEALRERRRLPEQADFRAYKRDCISRMQNLL
ncbi:MAG: hypothetical protein ABEL76_12130, partial [Bradymonadaceae bacterium]